MPVFIDNIINFLNPSTPKGLIDCAEDWVRQRRQQDDIRASCPSAWSRRFDEEREMLFDEPRLHAADDFRELPNVRWAVARESRLYCLSGARILGAEAAVISPDNRVFREFNYPPGTDWREHSCFKRRRIPAVQELKGWYATVAYPSARFYFHWIMESLPRMKLLQDYVSMLDGIFVPESPLPFHKQSLAMLGIAEAKLIAMSPSAHFKPEHLFVPQYCAFYAPAPWMHHWYKSAFLGATAENRNHTECRRIYLSRADANARKVSNEDGIVRYLEPLGFKVLTMTGMEFGDQARLFHGADMIVAPHGAALANLVFCKPGTKVVEIFPPKWMPPCYFAIAKSAGLSYSYMVANESPNHVANCSPQSIDLTIPLAVLSDHVDAALRQSKP